MIFKSNQVRLFILGCRHLGMLSGVWGLQASLIAVGVRNLDGKSGFGVRISTFGVKL
jgi:hypothetical protein